MEISSYSPFKYFNFRGFTLTAELTILKVAMIELAYSAHLISINNYFHLAKKLNRSGLHIKNRERMFYCRPNTTDILHVLPSYERRILKFMTLNHGIFVDVGAHIGSHTIRMAPIADHVYAFEPTPSAYNTLLRNIQLNNRHNITAIQLAISNKNGKAPLYINELNTGENSLNPGTSKKSIWVETRTLDKFLEENNIASQDIKLVKVDVEGAEEQVFQGAEHFLKNFNPRIIFESLNKENFDASSKILHNLGYQIMNISDGTNFIAVKK
jgi:FkbM family methyltransferase